MALLIVGMHRSGTSAVARLVTGFGLEVGPGRAMAPSPENAHGYFESHDVMDFNQEWLARLGGTWWSPPRVDERQWHRFLDSSIAQARKRIEFFDDRQRLKNWVIKDPRISLLLPLWDRLALRELPAIWVVRHPMEVAKSLELRNGFTLGQGLALWHVYNAEIAAHVQGRQCLVVDFSRFVEDADRTAGAIKAYLSRCGIPAGDLPVADSLDPELRRQQWSDTEDTGFDIDELVASYESIAALHLQEAPSPPVPKPPPAWIGEVLNALDERYRLVEQVDRGTRSTDELRVEADRLRALLDDCEARRDELEEVVAARDAGVEHLSGVIAEREAQLRANEVLLEEVRQEGIVLRADLHASQHELVQVRGALSEGEARVNALAAAIEAADAEMRERLAQRDTDTRDLLAERDSEIARLHELLVMRVERESVPVEPVVEADQAPAPVIPPPPPEQFVALVRAAALLAAHRLEAVRRNLHLLPPDSRSGRLIMAWFAAAQARRQCPAAA